MTDRNPLVAVARIAGFLLVLAIVDSLMRPLLREPWQLHLLALTWLIVPLVALVSVMKQFRPKP